MPLDSNIIMQGTSSDIMGSMNEGLKMKDMMGERKAKQAALEEETAIKSAYKNNVVVNPDGTTSLNKKAVIGDLYKLNPMKAQETEKQFQADDELQRKQKFQAIKDQTEAARELAWSVHDEPSYQAAIKRSEELGLSKPGEHPPNFDPGHVKNMQMHTLSAAEQLAKIEKENQWGHEDKSKATEHGYKMEEARQAEGLKRGGSVLTHQLAMEKQDLIGKQQLGQLDVKGQQRLAELNRKDAGKTAENKTLVPGVGVALNKEDAKVLKGATEMKSKFDRQVGELIELREKYGVEYLNRNAVGRGKQLSKDILLTYKNLAKLGVLSKSDEDIINAIIPSDPLGQDYAPGQDPILHKLKKFQGDVEAEYNTSLDTRLAKKFNKSGEGVASANLDELSDEELDLEYRNHGGR